ncbi:MAG: hypothetical protein ABSF62_21585 [Bryobacteraceae bacterium]
MRYRLLACLLAIGALAMSQTKPLTIQELIAFIKHNQQLIKEGKSSDSETARFLAGVKLAEKLDESVIEDLQGAGVGQKTIKALERLRDQSQNLTAANLQPPLPDDPIPIPSSAEQGKILDEVRDYVRNYDSGLPDFICLEVETRRAAAKFRGGRAGSEPSFQTQDVITSKLTYFQHQEKKDPILNGSKPINTAYENLGGSTSTGDFAIMLRTLFEPHTQARFEWSRWTTLRHRLTMVFSFRVAQERSQWSIEVKDLKRQIIPAYSGEVFVDNENRTVTRLVQKAEDIPADFPIRRAESLLDYDYADVGGFKFLLPSRGEIQMDGTEYLADNINEYRFYRKYEVGSSISFDLPADLTADKPADKETKPAIDCKDPKNKDAKECKPAPVVKKQ